MVNTLLVHELARRFQVIVRRDSDEVRAHDHVEAHHCLNSVPLFSTLRV